MALRATTRAIVYRFSADLPLAARNNPKSLKPDRRARRARPTEQAATRKRV
jgi:hypothetical protein